MLNFSQFRRKKKLPLPSLEGLAWDLKISEEEGYTAEHYETWLQAKKY